MKTIMLGRLALVGMLFWLSIAAQAGEPFKVIRLWPEMPPGEKSDPPPEGHVSKPAGRRGAEKPGDRIGNVSIPTISLFSPPAGKANGTAVLVFPGGGYNFVTQAKEGTEICEWLNSLGVTAIQLKYRVPRRAGQEKHVAPLQDAQRAVGLIRERAAELGIDPQRIGVIGFSAGGHLAAALATSGAQRTDAGIDAADAVSCRPDFAMLIYPAYFTPANDLTKLAPEVQVTTNHPPTFMVMTEDDSHHVENVLLYSLALKRAKVPFELHVYPTGGHGYGRRHTGNPVATWPDRATDWLRNQGLLSRNSPNQNDPD